MVTVPQQALRAGGQIRPTPGRRCCATAPTPRRTSASVCFKHGPPRLVGVELEWLLHRPPAPRAGPGRRRARRGARPAHPDHARPASPALPLPAGSAVTVEPGGQIELASPPIARPRRARCRPSAPTRPPCTRVLAAAGLRPAARAADPLRPPRRILDAAPLPGDGAVLRPARARTAAARCAPPPPCRSASTPARPHDVAARWAALHALGPVLLAAFANSPALHGRRTGWKSARWACWLRADPARTAPPSAADATSADPAAAWARRVLDSPLLLRAPRPGAWAVPDGVTFADWIRGALPEPPTTTDLDYHLVHAVPAGPPARPPRGALPRRPAGPALGAAGRGAGRAAGRPRHDRPGARGVRSRPPAAGSPAPGTAWPTGCSPARPPPCSSWRCGRLPAVGAPDWVVDDLDRHDRAAGAARAMPCRRPGRPGGSDPMTAHP